MVSHVASARLAIANPHVAILASGRGNIPRNRSPTYASIYYIVYDAYRAHSSYIRKHMYTLSTRLITVTTMDTYRQVFYTVKIQRVNFVCKWMASLAR